MKSHHWLLLGAVVVGGFFAWKYRGRIMSAIAPDPTVTTLAGSTYGDAQDVPGTITNAVNGTAAGDANYNPGMPSDNSALTGMVA